jgi:hypothetical protein
MPDPVREKRNRRAPWRASCALLCALALFSATARAATPPPPPGSPPPPPHGATGNSTPHPPPPPGAPPPPPSVYAPAPAVIVPAAPAPPAPLPIAERIIYAPFYAAGLVLRYGLYYGFVMPFEVLGRTIAYGHEGGVQGGDPSANEHPP